MAMSRPDSEQPGRGLHHFDNRVRPQCSHIADHAWRVRDTVTGMYVDVLPGFTNFTIPPPPPSDTLVNSSGRWLC